MRPTGVVRSVRGLQAGDHVCWSLRSRAELTPVAQDLLVDARRHGDRFTYIGTEPTPELLAELDRWMDGAPPIPGDGVEVVSLAELSEEERSDPVGVLAAVVESALRAGFAGVRALTDCTHLVREDEARDYLRWEHLIDRYVSAAPMSCVCAYDRSVLHDTAVTSLATVHPLVSQPSPVHVFATHGAYIGLRGDLDAASVRLLEQVLERIPPPEMNDPVVIDVTGVGFVDVRSLRALDAFAQRHGLAGIDLHNAPPSAARILELIPMPHVRTRDVR